jgi:hypothetical protein
VTVDHDIESVTLGGDDGYRELLPPLLQRDQERSLRLPVADAELLERGLEEPELHLWDLRCVHVRPLLVE